MAIITCPECGQHPVSDRAASCPRCGCPITAVNSRPAFREVRPPNRGSNLRRFATNERGSCFLLGLGFSESSEFPESSVVVSDLTKLAELVDLMQGWCEELTIQVPLENHQC